VLGFGLLQGVLIGAMLSIFLLLRRGSRPQAVELGRIANTARFANLTTDAGLARVAGAFVFRVNGALLYFNVEYVRDEFANQLAGRQDAVRTAVFFLGTVPQVDLAGADMLIELRRHLLGRGIDLRLAGARSGVRQALVRAGLEASVVEAYADVDAALEK
jgi:MFS superfamily sulfate permease-like transporter